MAWRRDVAVGGEYPLRHGWRRRWLVLLLLVQLLAALAGTNRASHAASDLATPTHTATGTPTPPPPTPETSHLAFGYDASGRRTGLVYADGHQQQRDYDGAGRLSGFVQPAGGYVVLRRDGAGNLTGLDAPNGGRATWAYDGAGRPTGTTWAVGGTTLYSQTATLDAAGQRIALDDSYGTRSYGYDAAGRLTGAAYPFGDGEQDTYDRAGNRLTVTATSALSGTTVTTNQFDANDQLTLSTGPGGATGYSYDGNGNQTGSGGPAGTTANTYDRQGHLVRTTGPGTDIGYVYDGQGDRLRSYERGTPVWQLRTTVQDLANGGLSAALAEGGVDYAYLEPGDGAAPVSGFDTAAGRVTYLGADLLGSVTLATSPSGATIGAGSYDAWGNARADAGQTLLARLRAATPFGFAGQRYDAGPGTYDLRARRYDPATGRFQAQDPLAPTDTVPVTLNPYEYAGDMPTNVTDPSGMGWVWQGGADQVEQSAIAGQFIENLQLGLQPGDVQDSTQFAGLHSHAASTADSSGVQFWVPIYRAGFNKCGQLSFADVKQPFSNLNRDVSYANIVDRRTGMLWDVEHVEGYNAGLGGEIQRRLVDAGNRNGYWWKAERCNEKGCDSGKPTVYTGRDGMLRKGTGYPDKAFKLDPVFINVAALGVAGPPLARLYKPGRILDLRPWPKFVVAWEQEPGLILYKVFAKDDLSHFLRREHRIDPAAAIDKLGVQINGNRAYLAASGADLGGCFCFPAGTSVATPNGPVAIDTIRTGDRILAEDPATGKVEPERVLATIDDGVKPLIALDLSDGSTLKVTSNHPFYVESAQGVAGSGWLQAGQLRPGDRLRTADGRGVTVIALHWDQGEARVYTLTVERDHTFFAGEAGVLVHNCDDDIARVREAVTKLVPEAQAAAARARRITGSDKVAAVDPEGRLTFSLQSAKVAAKLGVELRVTQVFSWAKRLGISFNEHPYDLNVPGDYLAGHAEPQMAAWQSDEIPSSTVRGFATSRIPCPSCDGALRAAARTGVTHVVAYPGGVEIYRPEGGIPEP